MNVNFNAGREDCIEGRKMVRKQMIKIDMVDARMIEEEQDDDECRSFSFITREKEKSNLTIPPNGYSSCAIE